MTASSVAVIKFNWVFIHNHNHYVFVPFSVCIHLQRHQSADTCISVIYFLQTFKPGVLSFECTFIFKLNKDVYSSVGIFVTSVAIIYVFKAKHKKLLTCSISANTLSFSSYNNTVGHCHTVTLCWMGPQPECSVNMYAIMYSSTLVQRSPFKTATPKKEFVKLNRVTKWLHVWRTNELIILINQPSVIRLINLPIHVHPYFAFVARLWIAKRSNIIGSLCNEGIDTFLLSHKSSHSIHLGIDWSLEKLIVKNTAKYDFQR